MRIATAILSAFLRSMKNGHLHSWQFKTATGKVIWVCKVPSKPLHTLSTRGFVWRPDKALQNNLTWLLQQLPPHHLYPKFIFTKDFFFHRKFYWLQMSRMFLFAFVYLSSSALAFSFKKKNNPTHRVINKWYAQDTGGAETVPQAGRSLCMANTTWLCERREQTLLLYLNSRQSTKLPVQRWAPGNPSPTALTSTVQLSLKPSPGFNFQFVFPATELLQSTNSKREIFLPSINCISSVYNYVIDKCSTEAVINVFLLGTHSKPLGAQTLNEKQFINLLWTAEADSLMQRSNTFLL